MNDIIKSDALLAIIVLVLGLISTVDSFWEKITLIVLAVAIVALRTYLKSKRK